MTFSIGCQSHIKCTYFACMVTRVILTRLHEKKNQNFGLLACRILVHRVVTAPPNAENRVTIVFSQKNHDFSAGFVSNEGRKKKILSEIGM